MERIDGAPADGHNSPTSADGSGSAARYRQCTIEQGEFYARYEDIAIYGDPITEDDSQAIREAVQNALRNEQPKE